MATSSATAAPPTGASLVSRDQDNIELPAVGVAVNAAAR